METFSSMTLIMTITHSTRDMRPNRILFYMKV